MKNVVVTNASSTTALAVIRSLGRRNIPITALDPIACSVGFMSKYCTGHLLYEDPIQFPRETLATLIRIGKALNKPVLLPAGDDIIFLALKYRPILEKAFVLPLPRNDSLKYTVDKALTMQLAIKEGVPIPKTFTPSTSKQLNDIKDELTYPVVIKPRINVGFRNKFGMKIIKLWSFRQLTDTHELVSKYFPRPLIQEYIPGGTENLYSLGTVFDGRHRPLGIFLERKLHELIDGVTSCGQFTENSEITRSSLRMLKAIKWVGPAEVEFKMDPRDNEFKLMEINPRPFMWVNLPIESGLDIPYLWYRIAMGEKYNEISPIRKGFKFINLCHFFLGFVRELSSDKSKVKVASDHLKALKGHFVFDLLKSDDPLPFLSYPLLLIILHAKETRTQKMLSLNILHEQDR